MNNIASITEYTYILGDRVIHTPADVIKKYPDLPRSRSWSREYKLPRHLAEQCAHKLINRYHIDPDSLDLILYSTSLADTVNIGFGPYVQKSIGAHRASVLQIDCSCASLSAQLEVAKALINAGVHQRILVIAVSHMISRLEQAAQQIPGMLLGEGATALIVEQGTPNFDIYLEKTGELELKQAYPERSEDHDWHHHGSPLVFLSNDLTSNRPDKSIWPLISHALNHLLKKSKITIYQLDYLLCSSPDSSFLTMLADKLNFPRQQIISSFDHTGDLAQASIGTSLALLSEQDIVPGQKIAFIDFSRDGQYLGAGLINY